MPQPNKNEKKDDFIQRCMSDEESIKSFPDEKQRYAVCNSKWNKHNLQEALKQEEKPDAPGKD